MKPRKNHLRIALCMIAASIPIPQFADTQPVSEICKDTEEMAWLTKPSQSASTMPTSETSPSLSLLQIGGNYTYVNIKPNNLPALTGNLEGAQGLYEYRPMDSFYAGFKLLWRQGNTTGGGAERYLVDIDVHERFGYTMTRKGQPYLLTFFSGFGFRYLGHHLKQNHASMQIKYNEFYVPVGILADFKVNSCFAIGLNFTWMPQVDATVGLVPLGGAQWAIKREFANFLGELPLYFSMGEKKQYLVIFKPFYEYWKDGATTAASVQGLPLGLANNTYNFWGAELNVGFKF